MPKTKAKKSAEIKRKRELIARWLATFAVTATVVVATIVSQSEAVSADFLFLEAIGNDIIYHVSVETLYYDPDDQVASAFLEYRIIYPYEGELSSHRDIQSSEYVSIPLTSSHATTWIEDIPNFNYSVEVRLAVSLIDAPDSTILDEATFATPYHFSGSIYPNDIGGDYVVFSAYAQDVEGVEVTTTIDVYQGGTLISTTPFDIFGRVGQEGVRIRIDNLAAETDYYAGLMATYVDPDTSLEKTIEAGFVTFTTAPTYTCTITSFTEESTSFYTTVNVEDPAMIINTISYDIYSLDEAGNILNYNYGTFFTQMQGSIRDYMASIPKLPDEHFTIEISILKHIGESYYAEIIYTYNV